MLNFLIIFVIFGVFIALMAVGVMFGRKPIAGSCGGLANVGIERACGCVDVCKNDGHSLNNSENKPEISEVKIYKG